MSDLLPGRVKYDGARMDDWVQEALDDPQPGDVFHELYSYGVQVMAVEGDEVYWRSFSTETLGTGFESREKWSQSFRYGDHMPGKHTMHLDTRGEAHT